MFPNALPIAVAVVTQAALICAASLLESRDSTASVAVFAELRRAAQLSSAAYSECQGSAFGVTITRQLNDHRTGTQGFIGYDTAKKRISVVMKGSTSLHDFLNDLDIKTVMPTLSGVKFPAGVQVMHGIYSPWASVHSAVIEEVTSLIAKYPDYTLESTGHSMGGSLTYLSYIALAQNFPGKNVTSNAMAAFPIGNSAFASFGAAQAGTIRRGNNAYDGVPNMWKRFTHFGTEFYGAGTDATTLQCTGERDLLCSAGDGDRTVSVSHIESFGILESFSGCSSSG